MGSDTSSAATVAGLDQELVAGIAAQPVKATLNHLGELCILSLVRQLDAPPERVWPLLTQPQQLALWSPIAPSRPLESLGLATSQEDPEQPPVLADVLAAKAPQLLSHRWGQDTLRWELTAQVSAQSSGTQLALQHSFTDSDLVASFAAGWHICLAALALAVTGQLSDRPVGRRALDYGWEKLHTQYAEHLGVPGE